MTEIIPNFEILYEEGPILAVNKPTGLLTQAPPGIDSIEARVKNFLMLRDQTEEEKARGKSVYLGVPHRLDRPASGVLVFAKNVRAAHRVSDQFQSRTVEKFYWALVGGNIPDDEGVWTDYMRKIPGRAEAERLEPIHPEAREAILRFRTLDRFTTDCGAVTRLEIRLETGRTHQIRLQCGSRGFPILGDTLYGSDRPFGQAFDDERLRAIALHSRQMTFTHPQSREKITLTAPVSDDWRALGIE